MTDVRHDSAPWAGANFPPRLFVPAVVLATVIGAVLRAAHMARPFNRLMAWNEGHYAMIALNFDRYGLWSQHNELGVDRTFSPGVPWLIWGSMKLFGPSEAAARLPIVLAGIAAIPFMAAFAYRLTRSEQLAVAAAAFTAAAPGLIYFSQNVQLDTPSICCALAAAVLMLRYRDLGRRSDAIWAGVWLAAAIWFKFTTVLLYPAFLMLWWPARPRDRTAAALAAGAFGVGTALPSLLWIVTSWLTFLSSSGFTKRFFFRDWDLRGIAKALSEIPLAVEAHLFVPAFLLMVVGVITAVRRRARVAEIWVWCVPWVLLYVFAPWDSLTNRYYDLPATYLLTVMAAVGVWTWSGPGRTRRDEPASRRDTPIAVQRRAFAAALTLVVAVTVAYDAWDPMTDRIARASMTHVPPIDPAPFYSARIIAALPPGRTIADTPQTMFYAGGDPRWIEITGGDVRWKIDAEAFDYIVLNDYGHGQEPYYSVGDDLRAQLRRARYVQIAPAAWAHLRTPVADLGGYRDPATPYWSPRRMPAPVGLTEWQ